MLFRYRLTVDANPLPYIFHMWRCVEPSLSRVSSVVPVRLEERRRECTGTTLSIRPCDVYNI